MHPPTRSQLPPNAITRVGRSRAAEVPPRGAMSATPRRVGTVLGPVASPRRVATALGLAAAPRRVATALGLAAAPRRVATALGLAAALVVGLPAGAASAKPLTCAHHSTEVVRKSGSTLWTSENGKTLYACTSFYEELPHDTKLGPWSSGSRYSFDGADVAWTIRKSGKDVVWVSDGASRSGGTWLKGVLPTVGKGSSTDRVVQKLVVWGDAAGWATTKGTVMMAVRRPSDDPTLIGAGTPGASTTPATSPTTGNPQGLAADPPKPKGHRLVLGRWETADAAALAASLKLVDGPGGDGDECGGVTEYRATVKPIGGQPAVGIDWYSDWTSDSDVCN